MRIYINEHGIFLQRSLNVDENQHISLFFKSMNIDLNQLHELDGFLSDSQLLNSPILGDKSWCG